MKIYIGTDHILFTILYRKPTDCAALLLFDSNHSLKSKESIVFSQVLRYNLLIADDALLQKELNSLAISLLARQYRLEVITHNISKAILHSHDTLLYRVTMAASPKTVLPIVTPYSTEGRHFSQSAWKRWHIIENDPQLQNIWSNHPITAYHKIPQGHPSAFLPSQINISTFCEQRILPIIATDTFTTYMQPYPSQPHLSMETILLILAMLYNTWVAPPTQRPPSQYHRHVLHGLQYQVLPTLLLRYKHRAYQTTCFGTHQKKGYTKPRACFLHKEHWMH